MASTSLAPFLGQPGRNGGTLRRGNPGQRGTLALLQAQATHDLRDALKMAREMMRNEERHPTVRLAAAEFIRRCTGIDRAAPPARAKPAAFGVVRAPAAELAAHVEAPRPPGVKRRKGPPSKKGLGGTRVAPPGEGPPVVDFCTEERPGASCSPGEHVVGCPRRGAVSVENSRSPANVDKV